MPEYRIYLRDEALRHVAEIDHYERLHLIQRFNAVGEWELEIPAGSRPALLAQENYGIQVFRDGEAFFSGSIESDEREWGEKSTRLLAGPCDNVVLEDKRALPVPLGPPYTSDSHDVRTGVASTVMRAYVDANLGPSATAARRGDLAAYLTLAADPVLGATLTGRARFQPVLELLTSLALQGGDLGFDVRQDGAVLTFRVYAPVDRTLTAVFSPLLGTLRAFSYSRSAAQGNYIYVGGGGEGTARTIVEKGDSASVLRFNRRIETFRDRRDTTDAAELLLSADEELAAKADRSSLSVTPLDTEAMAFGRDFGLGDRVTVVITEDSAVADALPVAAIEVAEIVREVHVTLTPNESEVVVPIVGTPDTRASQMPVVYDALRDLRRRLLNLERR